MKDQEIKAVLADFAGFATQVLASSIGAALFGLFEVGTGGPTLLIN
jgi:hypothetical protein